MAFSPLSSGATAACMALAEPEAPRYPAADGQFVGTQRVPAFRKVWDLTGDTIVATDSKAFDESRGFSAQISY